MANNTNESQDLNKIWQPLAGVDRGCFACGFENPHGLQMKFETNGKKLRSQLILPERFRGWSNLIHGGVLSTILDETMSWTAIYLTGKFILTRGMRVDFKKPVRVGMNLLAEGYIEERQNERSALVAAEIRGENGDIYATARGEFALFTKKQFQRMQIIPDEDIGLMSALIRE